MRYVPENAQRAVRKAPLVLAAVISVCVFFAAFFLPGQMLAVQGVFLFTALAAAYLIAFPSGMYTDRLHAFRSRLSLRPLPVKQCALIVLAVLLLMPALSMFFEQCLRLFPGYLEYTRGAQAAFERAYGEYGFLPLFCLLVLLPAVCEEFFFRGYLVSALREAGIAFFPLIVIGGLVFAIFHFDIWRLFPVFVIGMIMVWLAERSGSILAPIVYHGANNAMVFIIALLSMYANEGMPAEAGRLAAEDAGLSLLQVFVAFFMAVVGVLALMRFARNAAQRY